MPADTPEVNQFEVALSGARTFLVNGLITDCGALVDAGADAMDWLDISTLQEPYRLEGKKTMGLDLPCLSPDEPIDWDRFADRSR